MHGADGCNVLSVKDIYSSIQFKFFILFICKRKEQFNVKKKKKENIPRMTVSRMKNNLI